MDKFKRIYIRNLKYLSFFKSFHPLSFILGNLKFILEPSSTILFPSILFHILNLVILWIFDFSELMHFFWEE
jgi:hypothetical protein